MNKTCLVVRGKQQNDDRFRPGTPTPDKHWAYLLLDSYAEYNQERRTIDYPKGIGIQWDSDTDDVISVKVTSDLWQTNEGCFEHLMSFVKQNDLTYEFPCAMAECANCEGHPSCISNEHTMPATCASDIPCETCPRAA